MGRETTRDGGLAVQLKDLQARLLREADSAGIPHAAVLDAIDRSVAAYRDATVTSLIPVLIEREVRDDLGLPTAPPPT